MSIIVSIGQRFDSWVVIDHAPPRRHNRSCIARCDCGTVKRFDVYTLSSGKSGSCGCRRAEKLSAIGSGRTHGMSRSPAYKSWAAMIQRCSATSGRFHKYHGPKGITVCDRWKSFENFYADMGERPAGGTLDRIDNDKNYEPGNCRWATPTEQSQNRSNVVWHSFRGESKPLTEWARDLGVGYSALRERLRSGWSTERAFTTPPRGSAA